MSGDLISIQKDEYDLIKAQLVMLDAELSRLLAQPLVYATVVKADNEFRLDAFEEGDRLLVIDKKLRKEKKFWGKVASQGVDPDGWCIIQYPNGTRDRVNIGLKTEIPQVKLLGKDDGMNVVITYEGKLFEVHGLPGTFFKVAENVKVDMETKQIHASCGSSAAGDVAYVKSIVDESHIEVENNGRSRVVIHGLEVQVKPSDRVMLDNSSTMIVRVLERDEKDRYNLTEEINTTWDDIAGLSTAKEQLIEALETPFKYPDVYKFYNMEQPKGILLYGPQGCGKTLCGKAAATSLAATHGKENFQSGFIYVKGPELLSKWVGQSEAEIRALFQRGREHYDKHGYPALLFIDEADAILPMRGSGKSSDVENTIVPMFLSEMDGLEKSGVMVLLATNQPKRLDPAVVREGRCDRHIKVSRPSVETAAEYFRIHMRTTPLVKGLEFEEVVETTAKELFHHKRVMYRVTNGAKAEIFRLSDALTGAMIAGVVAQAKSLALKRDLTSGKKPKGVTIPDFVESVQNVYQQHFGLNATFDLEDFCDKHGFDRKGTNVEPLPAFQLV